MQVPHSEDAQLGRLNARGAAEAELSHKSAGSLFWDGDGAHYIADVSG